MDNNDDISLKIKYELIRRGITQKTIAKELCISQAAVSLLIKGKSKSQRFDEWVKNSLGITFEESKQLK